MFDQIFSFGFIYKPALVGLRTLAFSRNWFNANEQTYSEMSHIFALCNNKLHFVERLTKVGSRFWPKAHIFSEYALSFLHVQTDTHRVHFHNNKQIQNENEWNFAE